MKDKVLIYEDDTYRITEKHGSTWIQAEKNDIILAIVVDQEEARRVIWQEIDDPDIEYVSDSMFVEVH